MKSALEATLEFQLKAAKLHRLFVKEFRAIAGRRYRWDFAVPARRLLIELQGGTFIKGAHSTGIGIQRDCAKLNAATLAGYHQLSFTKAMIEDGTALRQIEEFLSS